MCFTMFAWYAGQHAMVRGYSIDFRQRVLAAVLNEGVSARFGISESSDQVGEATLPERMLPKVDWRHEQWKECQARPNPTRLVFDDETWAKTSMAPLRACFPIV
jgi:hypothetical protein